MPVKGGGGGGNAKGVRAGAAFVELSGDDTKLARALSGAKAKIMGLASSLAGLGAKSLGAGAVLLAPLTAFLVSGVKRAGDIEDVADVFGLTADSASRMAYAFEVAGLSVEEMEVALKKLANSNTSGKGVDEYLSDVTAELNAIENPMERVRKSMELFGDKAGPKFLKVARQFEQLKGEATPLTEKDIENAEKISQAWNKVGISLKQSLLPMLDILVPIVQQVAAFVKANAGLLLSVFAIGAGLVAFGTAAFLVSAGITAVVTVVGLLVKGILLLLTPVGLVALAVGGLGALFVTQTELGREMGSRVGNAFREIAGIAKSSFGGIVNAIKAGDMQLAWDIVLATLRVAWRATVLFLLERWVWFKGLFVDGFKDAIAGIRLLFWDAAASIVKTFATVISGIVRAAAELLDAVGLETLSGKLQSLDFSEENINRNRDRIKQQIIEDRMKGQAEADAARNAGLAEARADLEKARQELAGLVGRANALGGAGKPGELVSKGGKGGNLAQQFADTIKGNFFAGLGKQQFGYSDTVNKRQEALLGAIKDGKGELPDKIGAAVADNLRLR